MKYISNMLLLILAGNLSAAASMRKFSSAIGKAAAQKIVIHTIRGVVEENLATSTQNLMNPIEKLNGLPKESINYPINTTKACNIESPTLQVSDRLSKKLLAKDTHAAEQKGEVKKSDLSLKSLAEKGLIEISIPHLELCRKNRCKRSVNWYNEKGHEVEWSMLFGWSKRFGPYKVSYNDQGEAIDCEELHDKDGYDTRWKAIGYNMKWYDREGYDHEGYNKLGFNKENIHKSSIKNARKI